MSLPVDLLRDYSAELASDREHVLESDGGGYESADLFAEDSEEPANNYDSEPDSDKEL